MYTIYVCESKMPVPIQFTVHTWLVTEFQGQLDRFDVFGFVEDGSWERAGHVYKNFNEPFRGCPVLALGKYRFMKKIVWPANTIYTLEGYKNSPAHHIYNLLHHQRETLPFVDKYNILLGPNSNTFTQWVLDRYAKGQYPLPRRAYGARLKT